MYSESSVINTYAWIKPTAVSNTIIKIKTIFLIVKVILKGINLIGLVKRQISKCPATILAERRTDRVIGRIIVLISSISTIKKIRTGGVPLGTKWAINMLKFKTNEALIILIHIHKEIDKLNVRWLDLVKTYGNKPNKLFIRINKKILIKICLNLWVDTGLRVIQIS